MKKTTLIAGLAVVLVSGIVIGAVGHVLFIHYRLARMNRSGPPGMRIHALERLASSLDLDDRQRKAVDAILARSRDEAVKLYEQQRPEVERLIHSTLSEIQSELTPGQQKSFQSAWDDFQRRHPGFRVPGHGTNVVETQKEAPP